VDAEQVGDPSFEQRSGFIMRGGRPVPPDGADQPRVDPVEFGVAALARPEAPLVSGKTERQQRVLEDQEGRDTLDLVDDDGRSRPEGPELAGKLPGPGEVGVIDGLVQQVDSMRAGQVVLDPGALTRAPRAEEEEGLLGRTEETRNVLLCHLAVILRREVTVT